MPSTPPSDQSGKTQALVDSNYGPWLLVSRRRGSAHWCGGGTRASHVPARAAVDSSPDANRSRGATLHSLHSGKGFAAGGLHSLPNATFCEKPFTVQPPIHPDQSLHSSPIGFSHLESQKNPSTSLDSSLFPHVSLQPISSSLSATVQIRTDKGKSTVPTHSKSPHPVLCSLLTPSSPLPSNKPPSPHSIFIEKVFSVLDDDNMEEDDS